jgi:hypothetical protein
MKPDPGRFGAVMQELQALATTPNPDATLVEACERIMVLRDELTRMYQAGHGDIGLTWSRSSTNGGACSYW